MEIDYYLSLSSPWTYLGHARFVEIAKRYDAVVRYKPSEFGGIFAVSGGLPLPKRSPQRQAYRMQELKRWKKYLGVPLVLEPKYFPVNPELAARWVLAAVQSGGDPEPLIHGVLRAVWAEEGDIADKATLAQIFRAAGQDPAQIGKAADQPVVLAAYDANTQEAIARNVFGAPSFVIDEEIFWGQDRLEFVERRLAAG